MQWHKTGGDGRVEVREGKCEGERETRGFEGVGLA